MTSHIKPIETRYKGYRFRSRLEARWAVFFDALGIHWEYEPEGFDTPDGPYLPDFRLRLADKTVWLEVKPDNFEGSDPRWDHVVIGTKTDLILAKGIGAEFNLDAMELYEWIEPWTDDGIEGEEAVPVCWDNGRAFCICTKCGGVGIEYEGRSERMGCCEANRSTFDKTRNYDHGRIQRAYEAALGARFEHGERP